MTMDWNNPKTRSGFYVWWKTYNILVNHLRHEQLGQGRPYDRQEIEGILRRQLKNAEPLQSLAVRHTLHWLRGCETDRAFLNAWCDDMMGVLAWKELEAPGPPHRRKNGDEYSIN